MAIRKTQLSLGVIATVCLAACATHIVDRDETTNTKVQVGWAAMRDDASRGAWTVLITKPGSDVQCWARWVGPLTASDEADAWIHACGVDQGQTLSWWPTIDENDLDQHVWFSGAHDAALPAAIIQHAERVAMLRREVEEEENKLGDDLAMYIRPLRASILSVEAVGEGPWSVVH